MKASDLSEPEILALLSRRPTVWHTHWSGTGSMPRVYDPTHPDAPEKVLLAKLRAMKRKGLIDGCDCGCRGDWNVETPVVPPPSPERAPRVRRPEVDTVPDDLRLVPRSR